MKRDNCSHSVPSTPGMCTPTLVFFFWFRLAKVSRTCSNCKWLATFSQIATEFEAHLVWRHFTLDIDSAMGAWQKGISLQTALLVENSKIILWTRIQAKIRPLSKSWPYFTTCQVCSGRGHYSRGLFPLLTSMNHWHLVHIWSCRCCHVTCSQKAGCATVVSKIPKTPVFPSWNPSNLYNMFLGTFCRVDRHFASSGKTHRSQFCHFLNFPVFHFPQFFCCKNVKKENGTAQLFVDLIDLNKK